MAIDLEDFKKVEIKVGLILSAEKIENSEKLLRLKVDFGEPEQRQVVSGISKHFDNPNELISKKCVFVTNLIPREIMGLKSEAMILAVSGDEYFSLLSVDGSVPCGVNVK